MDKAELAIEVITELAEFISEVAEDHSGMPSAHGAVVSINDKLLELTRDSGLFDD